MKKTKLLLGTMVALSAALVLTACGSKSGSASAKEKSISIMAPFIETDPPAKDNVLLKKIESYTGEKVNVTWVPNSSYEDKMNITLASDDIPDVMVIQQKSGGFIKSANSGAFWDLTNELKKYPNLAKANKDVLKNSSVNGKVYGVYRARDLMRTAVTIRKDWLKKLGLSEPKSVEDLYNIAKAFKEDDPDGNGKDDTYGLVIPKWPGGINTNSPYDTLATWFGAGNAWEEVDGKLQPTFMNSKYKESMNFVKKMISEGLVNSDYATMSADKWNDPFVAGKGGIVIDTYSRTAAISSVFKTKDAKNYGDFVTFTGNLTGPDGKLHALPTDGYSGFLAIPKSSVTTKAQLKQVLTFLNKLNTKEGVVLLNNGIKNKNFTVNSDGLATQVTPETSSLKIINNAVKSYAQISMGTNAAIKTYTTKPETATDMATLKKRTALMASDAKSAVFNPASSIVTDTYASKGAQLDQIIGDARLKYVAGQIDNKGWKDAINQWKVQGGSDLIKETNTEFAKMSD